MAVSGVNGERVPLPEPSWYQTEKTAQISGIALAVIGTVGAALALGAFAMGAITVAPLAVGVILSVALIAGSIYLLTKECWDDPAFVDKIAEKAKDMPLDTIGTTYTWERVGQYHIMSKEDLTAKLLKEVEAKNMTYNQVVTKYATPIQNQIFNNSALLPLLKKEIAAENMSVKTYKEKYGDQPVRDKILPLNDTWLQDTLKKEIKGKSYLEITTHYSSLINKTQITEEMERQLNEKGFQAFYSDNKTNFYAMFDGEILKADSVRESAMNATRNQSVKGILDSYSWDIFNKNILRGADFKARFEQEVRNMVLSEVLRQYGYGTIYQGLTSREFLHGKVGECQNWTFDQIIERYGWKIFEECILLGADVQRAFHEKASSYTFGTLWNELGPNIERFGLFNAQLLGYAKQLGKDLNDAEKLNTSQKSVAQTDYDKKLASAKEVSTLNKKVADQRLDLAIVAYNAERLRQGLLEVNHRNDPRTSPGFVELNCFTGSILVNLEYWCALTNRDTVYANAEREYGQACVSATQEYNDALQRAEKALNQTRQQIDINFRAKIAA